MNSFTSRVLQDISHGLPQKSLQLSASRLHTTPSSRRFWSFFEFSRKEKASRQIEKLPISKNAIPAALIAPKEVRNVSESVVASANPSKTISLNAKPPCFNFTNKLAHKYDSKASKAYLEPNNLMSLLDGHPMPNNMKLKLKGYKTLRHENAGDFAFVPSAIKSRDLDILPKRDLVSKSATEPRDTLMTRIRQAKKIGSFFDAESIREPLKALARTETVTKLSFSSRNKTDILEQLQYKAMPIQSKSQQAETKTHTIGKHEKQLLSSVKSAPPSHLAKACLQRPSRLPVRIIKPSVPSENITSNALDGSQKTNVMSRRFQENVVKASTLEGGSYQSYKKEEEVPTTMRLQPQPRGSTTSRGGTVGSGQPLSGNSGDGGSRKPPFPLPPITTTENYSVTKIKTPPKKIGPKFSGSKMNYSKKKSDGECDDDDKYPKGRAPKEECKRYCCPSLDFIKCGYEGTDCTRYSQGTAGDCRKTVLEIQGCPPKNEARASSCGEPTASRKNSSCNNDHRDDYKYQTCCDPNCEDDRLRNYQVCCPKKKTCKAPKKQVSRCTEPERTERGRQICTKPRNDNCRPTKCPEPKNSGCKNNRDYSQLANIRQCTKSTGGRRHYSTFSSPYSTSLDRRLVVEGVILRSYASDGKKASKPTGACTPAQKPKPAVGPCKTVKQAKPKSAGGSVSCGMKKKAKPPAKCLPLDQVGVLKRQASSCSSSTPPTMSKSDEYCAKKQGDACKVAKGPSKGPTSDRASREMDEINECKNKAKKKEEPKGGPCKPKSSPPQKHLVEKKDPCKPTSAPSKCSPQKSTASKCPPPKHGESQCSLSKSASSKCSPPKKAACLTKPTPPKASALEKKDPCKTAAKSAGKPTKRPTGLERVISPCKQRQLKKQQDSSKGSSICSKFALSPPLSSLPILYATSAQTALMIHRASSLIFDRSFCTSESIRSNTARKLVSQENCPYAFIDDTLRKEEMQELIPIEPDEDA